MRLLAVVAVSLLAACGQEPEPARGIWLDEVTADALHGPLSAGPAIGTFPVGAGAGLGDVDGDGDLDAVIARVGGPCTLLRNLSPAPGSILLEADGDFAEGVGAVSAHGVALGDYDGDGDLDLFLASRGPDHLYRNDGLGGFSDATDEAGVAGANSDVSASAMFVDVNDDGLLDLYVGNYHVGDERASRPEDANYLYLNLGDGSFVDVSATSATASLGLTHAVAAADLDGDGVVDLYLANDSLGGDSTFPQDALYVRQSIDDQGVPIYTDVAAERGAAADRLSMGIGLADFDADDDLDVYVTNWGENALLLWDAERDAYDAAGAAWGVGDADAGGVLLVGWSALPLDLDHDGALELFVVNGSVNTDMTDGPFQLDHYFRQSAPGLAFADVTDEIGLPVATDQTAAADELGRGAFSGDLDGDGDLDLLLGALEEAFRVHANRTTPQGHFVRLRLIGTASAPDPVGAIVTVVTAGGRTLRQQRIAGGQPYGQSDNLVDLGLGDELPERIDVTWPSGLVQRIDTLPDFAVDRETRVTEPAWITLSARVAGEEDEAPLLTITAEPGQIVAVTRSDGEPVALAEEAGTFTATLPHPGAARRTTLAITIDGAPIPLRPMLTYR